MDVHVRRLRAKLGTEHEALTGTVRYVGYHFVPAKGGDEVRVPRSSRPEDPDPGLTEANGLAPDEQRDSAPRDRAPRDSAPRDRALKDRAPKDRVRADSAPQDTEPKEASAAPADRR